MLGPETQEGPCFNPGASEFQLLHSGECPGQAFVDCDFRVQRQEIDVVPGVFDSLVCYLAPVIPTHRPRVPCSLVSRQKAPRGGVATL